MLLSNQIIKFLNLKHDSSAVSQFVKVLDAHLSVMYPHSQRIVFRSDGCAAQYKSAPPFYRIANRFDRRRSLEWNYFGSNHGKVPSDGETGVVKTFASGAIASDGVCLDNALELLNFLSQSVLQKVDGESRWRFYYVDEDEVEADGEKLIKVKTIPDTHKIHRIIPGVSTNSVSADMQ